RVALVPVRVFPRAASQATVDADLSTLGQVLGADLCLLVPGRDPHEVGLVLPGPVDREQEARDLKVFADLPELDVRGEITDQRYDVHASTSLCWLKRQRYREKCGGTVSNTCRLSIGVPRFELGTSPTRTERATRLRHTPRTVTG